MPFSISFAAFDAVFDAVDVVRLLHDLDLDISYAVEQLFYAVLDLIVFADGIGQTVEKKSDKRQPLVEARLLRTVNDLLVVLSVKDLIHLIVRAVFAEEVVVGSEALGGLGMLEILPDELFVHGVAKLLVDLDDIRKIRPAARRDEGLSVYGGFDLVEVVLLYIKVSNDSGVSALWNRRIPSRSRDRAQH